jgi:hypothetical protein
MLTHAGVRCTQLYRFTSTSTAVQCTCTLGLVRPCDTHLRVYRVYTSLRTMRSILNLVHVCVTHMCVHTVVYTHCGVCTLGQWDFQSHCPCVYTHSCVRHVLECTHNWCSSTHTYLRYLGTGTRAGSLLPRYLGTRTGCMLKEIGPLTPK